MVVSINPLALINRETWMPPIAQDLWRNGKQVILLSYPGEAHNLTNRDNQKDFTIRMKQFFDHYLMDKPAPQWLVDGLPQVKKGGPIK